jgi:hypothetical protein
MRAFVGSVVGITAVVSGMLGAPTAAATPAGCGVNLAAPEIAAATRTLAPYPGTDWTWSAEPSAVLGNYDRGVTLSTALVSVHGATGSSPVTALMFHDGRYLGTATWRAYGFTSLDAARTTDDTVVLDYATPGACTACTPAAVTSVRYRWTNDRVVMLDPAPPVQ